MFARPFTTPFGRNIDRVGLEASDFHRLIPAQPLPQCAAAFQRSVSDSNASPVDDSVLTRENIEAVLDQELRFHKIGSMANVYISRKDSIVDVLEQLHERIACRAHDLFRGRDGWGDAFGDWFSAEQELISKPAVELREQDGTFTVAAALPGVDAKDITVDITPQDVVIKGATEHKHTEDKGQIHRCEFTTGQYFRSLPFPKTVDATKAKADYQNGMLNITVPIAPEVRAKRVDIQAA